MKHAEAGNYACPRTLGAGNVETCRGAQCAVWRWAEPKWGSMEQRRGYCGLGGEPKYPVNPDNETAG